MLQLEMIHGDRRLWASRDSDKWSVRSTFGTETAEIELEDVLMGEEAGRFFHAGCDRCTIYLKDTIFVVQCKDFGDYYAVAVFDALTGKCHHAWLTMQQIIAILILGVGGGEVPNSAAYYTLAEPTIADWPVECRPIP